MIFYSNYMENSRLYNFKKIEKQNRNHLRKYLVLRNNYLLQSMP